MAKSRAKNTPREIRDIRFPTSHIPDGPAAAEIPDRKVQPVPLPRRHEPSSTPRRPILRLAAAFILLSILAIGAGVALWYRGQVAQTEKVRDLLAGGPPSSSLSSSFGDIISTIKDLLSNYGNMETSPLRAVGILGKVSDALGDIPARVIAGDGVGLAADLDALRGDLASLEGILNSLSSEDGVSPSEYAAYAPDLQRARIAAERLLAILRSPGEHHLLVLFGNSAELRPGGGFLGSFADIAFGSSTIGEVVVRDVNEVDRGLADNIVPPKPMQGIATRWRAADANWFFDYRDSAGKTLEFMSRSSLYASSTLDGAILITPKVIQDILGVLGPISLDDGKLVVDRDTIIPMIQREVQAGQASGAKNPKEILSELLPPLEAKLGQLDDAAAQGLLGLAREWMRDKDLMFFFEDEELMKTVSYYRADGGIYATPQSFSGDYLAAVNSNIGGGKSDAFIADTIDIESDLRADGVVENRVIVVRESSVKPSDEWWYRETNQDYLQLFTPIGVALTGSSGGKARMISPRADYSKNFETDADLAAIESTLKPVPGFAAISQFRESDKNVFATWITTQAGGSSAARFQYRRSLKNPFRDGGGYTFVFERQSGARQSLHLVLLAPPGFVWAETGVSKYEYLNEAVPGRVALDLTLKAI